MDFIYDESGKPFALNYSVNGGTSFITYYYVLNLQGDVESLISSSGYVTASYTYNAWGEILSVTDQNGNEPAYDHIANLNPLRYRGYYYDRETGWYYLQSRYYDPVMHRFINADTFASTGQGLLGCNMFAYCNNNPVAFADETGHMAGIQMWNTLMTDAQNNRFYTQRDDIVILVGDGELSEDDKTYIYSYEVTLLRRITSISVNYVTIDAIAYRNANRQIVLESGAFSTIYGHRVPVTNGTSTLYAFTSHAGYRSRVRIVVTINEILWAQDGYSDFAANSISSGANVYVDGIGHCGGMDFMPGIDMPWLQQPR